MQGEKKKRKNIIHFPHTRELKEITLNLLLTGEASATVVDVCHRLVPASFTQKLLFTPGAQKSHKCQCPPEENPNPKLWSSLNDISQAEGIWSELHCVTTTESAQCIRRALNWSLGRISLNRQDREETGNNSERKLKHCAIFLKITREVYQRSRVLLSSGLPLNHKIILLFKSHNTWFFLLLSYYLWQEIHLPLPQSAGDLSNLTTHFDCQNLWSCVSVFFGFFFQELLWNKIS